MGKFIFVTGGVASSLGKGVCVSSLGALLEARGLRVSLQKIDPYLNIDSGTMSPYEHGEVYVTEDGAEADLDLGNYERFTQQVVHRVNSMTTGQVYMSVLEKERRGDYLGKTVQIIPHITDEIKHRIRSCAEQNKSDIHIVEVGGTVGDIESVPFLEAIRQMARDEGHDNVVYMHLTLAPYLVSADEVKSKPTQHSVKELMKAGIHPQVIVCRSVVPIKDEVRAKIALFCDVDESAVISAYNAPHSVYEMPGIFAQQGLDKAVLKGLSMPVTETPHLELWDKVAKTLKETTKSVKIAFVGKYVAHKDAYKSVYEALTHAGITHSVRIELALIDAEVLGQRDTQAWSALTQADGLLVPGGFGERGVKGMILAIKYAREHDKPFFGICLGMQVMAIEFARSVLYLEQANSSEFAVDGQQNVISLMEEQKTHSRLGGTMRLGSFEAHLSSNSLAIKCYGTSTIHERHRHRYEFSNSYRNAFTEAGMVFSGENQELGLVEIMELSSHRWFLGGQFHPEFKSKPFQAHPLFAGFVGACLEGVKK
jgi:CTP synthase